MFSWSQLGTVMDAAAMYLTLQYERCVLVSVLLIGFVMVFRKTVFARQIFLKGILWSLFIMLPFLGRLKLFYENPVVLAMTWRLTGITMRCLWIGRIYMAGMAVAAVMIFGKRWHLKRIVSKMDRNSVSGTEICVTAMNITPFTIGLFKPKIILPEIMLRHYSETERKAIVQHEWTHIRLGHLWCYLMWDILRCLLWVNPLLSICQKYFRADLEDMCDRVCIQNSEEGAIEYGQVLLKSLKLLGSHPEKISTVVTYAGEKEFEDMKRRIGNIASFRSYRKSVCIGMVVVTAVAICGLLFGVHRISYARCSELDGLLVYEYRGEGILLSPDSDRLHQMIHYDEKNVYVDRVAFDEFLQEKGATGEIYIVFGGFQKFPGIGGGAYSVLYQEGSDEDGIVRIAYEKPKDDWVTMVIKML